MEYKDKQLKRQIEAKKRKLKLLKDIDFRTPLAPTVNDNTNFDPLIIVGNLRKALTKGQNDKDSNLITSICSISNAQRQIILQKYNYDYKADLINDIKSKTIGNFRKVLVGLMQTPIEYVCNELRDAVEKFDAETLIDLLCSLTPFEIRLIKGHYYKRYGTMLSNDFSVAFSENFLIFAIGLLNVERRENKLTDTEKAKTDIDEILSAQKLKIGTIATTMNKSICNSNPNQLKLIFRLYKDKNKRSLQEDIKRQFNGPFRDGLLAVCECAESSDKYFATQLYKSMKGLGTKNDKLIRIIIMRSEMDLENIKCQFLKDYKKTLREWIQDDTSGAYRDALMALI